MYSTNDAPNPSPTNPGNQAEPLVSVQTLGEKPQLEIDGASKAPGQLVSEEREVTESDPLDFPEGGRQAWLVVFGSFCALLSVFGGMNTAGVFESYFSTHLLKTHSSSQIGWIFGIYLFTVFFVGIQVGPIFDRYGPRTLVAVGGILVASSFLILSFCKEYYQIIISYSVLGGLGGALLNTPAYSAIAHYFSVKRGLAVGIATSAGSIGGIIFPVVLQRLIPSLGFAWSTRIMGFILLGLAVPPNLFLRSRLPPLKERTSIWPDFSIFKDVKFLLSTTGMFFVQWGVFIPLTYIVSYGSARTFDDPTDAYTLLSILCTGSALGRLIPGLVADSVGRFNTTIVTLVLCILTIFCMWLPAGDSKPTLMAFAALFGFSCGSNLGLIPVCLGQLCDARVYGRFLSTALMVASFGTLSSSPIAGAILQAGKGDETAWVALITFSGAAYIISLICFISARVVAVGWNPLAIF